MYLCSNAHNLLVSNSALTRAAAYELALVLGIPLLVAFKLAISGPVLVASPLAFSAPTALAPAVPVLKMLLLKLVLMNSSYIAVFMPKV